ncbi:phage terminase large subunit family protein [Roseisalinus antarcticus]|uniref:Phage terminase large subunit (GpA) n=1 Tax=Roseisalinus antarcticus TaxID=254357 RepID=A0A1Y5U008_9RHOB|nr:terminase gpA endonuclease subunit [Roseisalinus antarcticus]SLN77644.1 Phage terminase large subunit (GpA) [Roseisalinus antarcticus]
MTLEPRFAELRREALAALHPPPKLRLSDWIEANVYLPSSLAAQPGRMRLWPPQREIADAIGDDSIEQVVLYKSARVGATQLMVAALGHFVQNDPSPVLAVLPVDSDCRHFVTSIVEPTFSESPALRAALSADATGRDTMMTRHFPGGSLSIVSARSPRNLRARTARVIYGDELDAWENTAEGDPLEMAIRRSMTYPNAKLVLASTPIDADTSRIVRAYEATDQRVYTLPCPGCGEFVPVEWKDIRWEPEQPETAHWRTPCCETIVQDRQKAALVDSGRWTPTAEGVTGRRGYRLTSLTSTLPAAAWPRLAAEFLQAKRSPATLKPWLATALGEPWRGEGDDLDGVSFPALQRPFSAEDVPSEVLVVTAGCDVQADRVETTLVGWTREGDMRVLGHVVTWGSPTENETWIEVDDLLRRQFRHPAGSVLTVDATIIDSGNWADAVYAFCRPRAARRVLPGKGVPGFGRPGVAFSQTRKVRLALLGVDGLKLGLHQRLAHGETILFSNQLGGDYFDQLRAERLVTRYTRGRPTRAWEVISGRRNEALDTLTYATAARQLLSLDLDRREGELASVTGKTESPRVIRSKWLDG